MTDQQIPQANQGGHANVRVYAIAKQYDLSSKDFIQRLADYGVSVKSHMSTLDAKTLELIETKFSENADVADTNTANEKADKEEVGVEKSAEASLHDTDHLNKEVMEEIEAAEEEIGEEEKRIMEAEFNKEKKMRVNTMTKYPPVKTTLILNEVTQNQLDELSKSEFTSKSQYLRKVISEQHQKMNSQIERVKNFNLQSA